MRARAIVLILVLVGGFWFVTTHLSQHLGHFSLLNTSAPGSPLQLTEAEAAPAYDVDEQNNIAVYKKVLPSVVNITSTTSSSTSFMERSLSRVRAQASSLIAPDTFSPIST